MLILAVLRRRYKSDTLKRANANYVIQRQFGNEKMSKYKDCKYGHRISLIKRRIVMFQHLLEDTSTPAVVILQNTLLAVSLTSSLCWQTVVTSVHLYCLKLVWVLWQNVILNCAHLRGSLGKMSGKTDGT